MLYDLAHRKPTTKPILMSESMEEWTHKGGKNGEKEQRREREQQQQQKMRHEKQNRHCISMVYWWQLLQTDWHIMFPHAQLSRNENMSIKWKINQQQQQQQLNREKKSKSMWSHFVIRSLVICWSPHQYRNLSSCRFGFNHTRARKKECTRHACTHVCNYTHEICINFASHIQKTPTTTTTTAIANGKR